MKRTQKNVLAWAIDSFGPMAATANQSGAGCRDGKTESDQLTETQ